MGLPDVCTSRHQRNRSLDSVLQCIPEDNTPTSPELVGIAYPQSALPWRAFPSNVPAGSDDSGIHCALASADPDPDQPDPDPDRPDARADSASASGSEHSVEQNPPDTPTLLSEDSETVSIICPRVLQRCKFPFDVLTGSDDSGILCALTNGETEIPEMRTKIKNLTHESEPSRLTPNGACGTTENCTRSKLPKPTKQKFKKPEVPKGTCGNSTGSDEESWSAVPSACGASEKIPNSRRESDSDPDEIVFQSATARLRESLDSGNPEDVEISESSPAPSSAESKPPAKVTTSGEDSLLTLFKCEVFNMSMAIHYLFKYKDVGVRTYLANKLFSFPTEEVDFYLPQLATLFIEVDEDLADLLKPYFIHRCKQSADFSLRLVWLLTAFIGSEQSRASKLRDSIIAEKVRYFTTKKGHFRSHSDASALRISTSANRFLGDLTSGRAFDNGCTCSERCDCGAPRLLPQTKFLNALTDIGRRLSAVADKQIRKVRLREELTFLDLNLPAKVSLPLHKKPHYVLRIPPDAAAVLNSKDKAPYIIYVEVLEVEGAHASLPARLLPLPPQAPLSPPIRNTKSEENLVSERRPLSTYDVLDLSECWSPDEDEVSAQYPTLPPGAGAGAGVASDAQSVSAASLASGESCGSRESSGAVVRAREVRLKLQDATTARPNKFRHNPSDPSAQVLKESWECKLARIRALSPYGALPGWRLLGCIVKVGDDLRQELLASQILRRLSLAWSRERLPLHLQLYEILCLDKDSGFIQPVLNSLSLHQIKVQSKLSLRKWLELEHGPPTSEGFLAAQRNFVESAAAYSIVSYLLQLKDRHNGNILLSSVGHLIHIDFGFILSISPKNLKFESSPFKLTSEFVEVMDGEESDMFHYFKVLILKGLKAARKHMDDIMIIVEVMRTGGQIACLNNEDAVESMRKRFHGNLTEEKLKALVDTLVSDSLNSKSTKLYDNYQYLTNGIL